MTEVVYRTLDAGRRRAWARRQVRPGADSSAAAGTFRSERTFASALPASARADVYSRGRVRTCSDAADSVLAGDVDGIRIRRGPTAPTRTGSTIR